MLEKFTDDDGISYTGAALCKLTGLLPIPCYMFLIPATNYDSIYEYKLVRQYIYCCIIFSYIMISD